MNNVYKRILSAFIAVGISLAPLSTVGEDIDIFTGVSAGASERPNVLIVLDNTSNWARQSQGWPGGLQQGQAEVRSIKALLDAVGNDVNIGVMEFVTNGNANDNGGFIRFPILQMTSTNKDLLKAEMDRAFSNINGNNEKRNSNTPYGNLKQDVYNYFAGMDVSKNGDNNTRDLDPPGLYVNANQNTSIDGYFAQYNKFKTPLSSATSCAKNYVIFIGNPNSSGPADDDASNNAELVNRLCSTKPIPLPLFSASTLLQTDRLGNTNGCYSSASACTTSLAKTVDCSGLTDAQCKAAISASGSEFMQDTNGDGIAEPVCTVSKITVKGKTSYDGTYMIPDGTSAQRSGCACTTPYTEPGSCAPGELFYDVFKTEETTFCDTKTNCEQNKVDGCGANGASCSCTTSALCAPTASKRLVTKTTKIYLGKSACSSSLATCDKSSFSAECGVGGVNCSCEGTGSSGASCGAGESKFTVTGTGATITNTPTGAYDATGKGAPWHMDEWAQCMYQKGVPVAGGQNQTVSTYTIDVYNKSPNTDQTALLMSAAHKGGGKYFTANNEDAILNALKQIFAEIQSVNSTFASASLPVNATNRAQNENQVFIGMFRPDQSQQPRWYGNLKRYKLVFDADGVSVRLGDKNGAVAVNNQTGFVSDCAVSYWTTDSPITYPSDSSAGYYWEGRNVTDKPDPASKCEGLDASLVYSDLPDGPTVEKGAVAEVIRKGNAPGATSWNVNRTVYTTTDAFSTTSTLLSAAPNLDDTLKAWVSGQDNVTPVKEVSAFTSTQTRASLHGDVVHSRPLPVTYGVDDTIVYYGANDGMFRAVDAASGKEFWALIPFEFAQEKFVGRLRNNFPIIKYPNTDMSIDPKPEPKTYGWDGSIGIAQNLDNTEVWIYPTMRRGGQMVYALDVSKDKYKTKPEILWSQGCVKDKGCTAGFENMGQSWSSPVVVPVAGYTEQKIALFGGGYDICEDEDVISPACGSARGANIYAVDAKSGKLLKSFATDRSVVSEVSVADMNGDGKADYAYVGDTGGNLYRITMVDRNVASNLVVSYVPREPSAWTMRKIASGEIGQKFLFQPALLPLGRDGRVYVAIGSGDREHPLASNEAFKVQNSLYVLLDDVTKTEGVVKLTDLENKSADQGCASTSILPGSDKAGWFINLRAGEQTVTSALIIAGQVVFSTNRPIPPAAGTCSTVLGEARGYWVNLFNASGTIDSSLVTCGGDRSSTFVGGGLPPSPVTGTVLIDGKPTTVVIGAVDRDGGTSTPISPGKVVPAVKPVRTRIYHKTKGVD